MKSDRMARVNRLIQGALAEIIPVQIKDPRVQSAGIFSITGVRTTPDLRFATVYVSVNAEQEQAPVIDGLNGAKKFIRSKLGRRVHIKYTPELTFKKDEVIESAARIETILAELATEDDNDR